jgi:hypothetical protein
MRAQKSKPKNLNFGDDEMNVGSFGYPLSPTEMRNGAPTFGFGRV